MSAQKSEEAQIAIVTKIPFCMPYKYQKDPHFDNQPIRKITDIYIKISIVVYNKSMIILPTYNVTFIRDIHHLKNENTN